MSRRGFLEEATRHRATAAIRQIESGTAAEVVVAVRKRASRYQKTSIVCGVVAASLVLLVLLLSPTIYYYVWIGVDALLAFVLVTLLVASVEPLRRAFTSGAVRRAAVDAAAQLTFDELGIAKTRDRTGLLVFVALEERLACVLPDEGISQEMLSEDYARAVEGLVDAAAHLDEDAFLSALLKLEHPLAQVLPRQPDDENELSDDVA
jgi:putative membrane protein